MAHTDVLLELILRELAASGIDPTRWVMAWARLIPSLVLIPAFGLQAFPIGLRLTFAFVLGASVAPGLTPFAAGSTPLIAALGAELLRGVPVALSVAISVWGAGMAGSLIDELRGSTSLSKSVFDGEAATPFSVLMSLVVAVAFFQLGGPARLADALATAPPWREQDLRAVALSLAHGIQFAVVLAGPLLAIMPFLELMRGLVARASHPIALGVVLAPFKAVALLAVAALLLDRFASTVVLWLDRSLPSS